MLGIQSVRPFIGSKDFETSRAFYRDLGFEEHLLQEGFAVYHYGGTSFYLQKYYVKEWLENTMLFFVVQDVYDCYTKLKEMQLDQKYPGVKIMPIREEDWGTEIHMLDPAGVLLHFGNFKAK